MSPGRLLFHSVVKLCINEARLTYSTKIIVEWWREMTLIFRCPAGPMGAV